MKLIEYGDPVAVQLNESELEELRNASFLWRKRLKLKYEPLSIRKKANNFYFIRAKGIAGFITVGKLHFEIVPKFIADSTSDTWKIAMWRFLSYGKGFDLFESTRLGFSRSEGIVDLLAELFLTSVQGVNEVGYALSYKEVETTGQSLSGYLNPDKYDSFLPVTGELYLISDELSYDNEINQLLKWAGKQLECNVESNELRKRLIYWSEDLNNVSDLIPVRKVEAQRLNNYSHLKQAVEISELLLDDLTVNFSQDYFHVPGFLWDSDALFERAIFRLFEELLLGADVSVSKSSLPLAFGDNGQALKTIPDLIFKRDKNIVLLGDAKYKNYNGRPSPEDFYQVMAGAALVGIDSSFLIYPASGDGFFVDQFSIPSGQKPSNVYVLKIGINAFYSKIMLREVKQEMKAWVEDILV
ncbi:hypothetical protein ACHELT_004034 [Vibrio alginolyticus]|nr:hypothetical protein [Vibrio alginolyticus]